jgi:hypothetical protein
LTTLPASFTVHPGDEALNIVSFGFLIYHLALTYYQLPFRMLHLKSRQLTSTARCIMGLAVHGYFAYWLQAYLTKEEFWGKLLELTFK